MKAKRYKSKNKNNFRIFLLFCFSIIGLTVGYSALNEEIKITGEAFVRPVKDVRITDVRLSETANEGLNSYNNFNVDSINVGASLPKTDSTVTYEVDISNIGDVSVIVKSITPDYGNNSNIEYVIEGIEVGKTIIGTNANKTDTDMGKPTTIKVTIKYKDGVTTIPTDPSTSLKLTFEFVPVSILAKSLGSTDTSVFNNSNITRDNVKTITFKNTINVPTDVAADKVWDASLNKDNSVIAYYTTEEVNNVAWYNVVIGGYGKVQFPPDSSYLFKSYKNLEKLDFGDYIDTSNVTSMKEMFSECSGLTTLDVTKFVTSNVNNMSGMFSGGIFGSLTLKTLDLSNFDTSNVTNIGMMFENCTSLEEIKGIENFDTSKVTTMVYGSRGLFKNCKNLKSLNLSNWVVNAKVTNMSYMFYNCSGLTSLNVTSFDTSSVTNMDSMFYNCSGLTTLDVTKFNTPKVTNMSRMFSDCSGLTSLDVTNFNTQKVTDMSQMFKDCSGLTSLDVSKFNTSKVTNMNSMFDRCQKLTSLDVTNFDTSNVTNMGSMFYNCSGLTSLDVTNFNTSKVTNMKSMFERCQKLTSLDVTNFDTSSVTNMAGMFSGGVSGNSALKSLDLTNFDTSKVTDISMMFENCTSLEEIKGIESFATSNVTTMVYGSRGLFQNCKNLKSLDLSKWVITSNVTDMRYIFSGCSSLTNLNLSNFDTSNVTKTDYMFANCWGLTNLNIKSFTFDKVTSFDSMLSGVPSSAIIYVKDQTAYDFINGKKDGGCTADKCPICSNTGVTCP